MPSRRDVEEDHTPLPRELHQGGGRSVDARGPSRKTIDIDAHPRRCVGVDPEADHPGACLRVRDPCHAALDLDLRPVQIRLVQAPEADIRRQVIVPQQRVPPHE